MITKVIFNYQLEILSKKNKESYFVDSNNFRKHLGASALLESFVYKTQILHFSRFFRSKVRYAYYTCQLYNYLFLVIYLTIFGIGWPNILSIVQTNVFYAITEAGGMSINNFVSSKWAYFCCKLVAYLCEQVCVFALNIV